MSVKDQGFLAARDSVNPIYKNIHVTLVGVDGNAFSIMTTVVRALRRAGLPEAEIARYKKEAMSGNYDDLLMTTMKWVNVK